MTNRIEGKIVVITGASSGLGEAAARHLAAQGAKVVLGARRADRLEALVGDIVAAGGEALAVQTDVTNRADVAHLVDTAVQVFGRIRADQQRRNHALVGAGKPQGGRMGPDD